MQSPDTAKEGLVHIVSDAGKEVVNSSQPEKKSDVGKKSRGAFVPKYEPIQTRKRSKTTFSHVADTTKPKVARSRLSKEEVLTPQRGPKPQAVPKSLLILEPDMLPKHFKKKQERMNQAQVFATAKVEKNPAIAWPTPSEVTRQTDLSVSKILTPAEKSNSLPDDHQEITVLQTEDGTSYIITSEGSASYVEGSLEMEGQSLTVISQDSTEDKNDTPASLLLLAEAAYPTEGTGQSLPPSTPATVVAKQCAASGTECVTVTSASVMPSTEVTSSAAGLKTAAADGKTSVRLSSVPAAFTVSVEAGKSPRVLKPPSQPDAADVMSRHVTSCSAPSVSKLANSLSSQWTCTVCGELMPEKDRSQHLTQHLDEETEEELTCEVCGETMRDEEELELHSAVEHEEEEEGGGDDDIDDDENLEIKGEEEGTMTESIISKTASPPAILTSTAPSRTPIHTCPECGANFAFQAYLRQHMKKVHSEGAAVVMCDICTKTFNTAAELESHISLLHRATAGGITFKCVRCSQTFSSVALLSEHALNVCQNQNRMIVGLPPMPKRGRGRGRGAGQGRGRVSEVHTCNICNKTFTSEFFLKAHRLSHKSSSNVQTGQLQCLYCWESFRHLGPLKEHILSTHPKAFPFKCTICQRGFSRESSRVAHEQTHQTEKLHFCTECGEGFTLETYLKRHMKYRHLKQVKLPCPNCKKTFVRQADLIKHRRVHTGEKPYKCEQCGHAFGQQSNYKYHMMRHRGEKPHVCPICNKGFRVPSHLKIHMQQHVNARYVCHICDKVFSQGRYLQRHLKTHSSLDMDTDSVAQEGHVIKSYVIKNSASQARSTRSEEQIIVDSISDDISEHVVVQETGIETEPVIEFIINKEEGRGKRVEIVDQEGNTVTTSSIQGSILGETIDRSPPGLQIEVMGEQAYVSPEEGTRVVIGAYSGEEGSSMEEGSVTLPFKDLTQLLGGKHYNCDMCSQSFSVRPDSTYNMVHTGHGHILVINLNDHHHVEESV